jgi:phenol 2-monooxygenase
MQFHLNGLRPGDPLISEADVRHQAGGTADGLPTQVDVLIFGCGSTGLTVAAQLTAFSLISRPELVEQKSSRLLVGQADGIACRTMEMFEAFGFADRVMKEAYWVNEFAFWKTDESRLGG